MRFVGFHNTVVARGQPQRLVAALFLALLAAGCHRSSLPMAADPSLPPAFQSPEATFQTWVAASLRHDPGAIRECYWPGMAEEELKSWMTENLRSEAEAFFYGSQLLSIHLVSPLVANFSFRSGRGDEAGGVMVRTRQGWKIQRW